jgi:endonuclease/exonuclease/phosphatase family metal-dependent hydrolase
MPPVFRVVSYNIHKGVRGLGPARRLEIHNLRQAIGRLDADLVCLQEVRKLNRREEQFFAHWPKQGQADFLAPHDHTAVYRSNAITRHGEHGNALLSRWPVLAHQHADMSDHRYEQRGLLHSEVDVRGQRVHVLVLHLGLLRAGRMRQLQQVCEYISRDIAADAPVIVAGDFNEWSASVRKVLGKVGLEAPAHHQLPTFPSALPLLALDHIYTRGLQPLRQHVPHGPHWERMSDHLPIVAEFVLPGHAPP